MKLLLDTHIFLWWTQDDSRLQPRHRNVIGSPQNSVYVSAATAWEIAIKRKIGKLAFTGSVSDAIDKHRFEALSISVQHGESAGALPAIHSDPFDRLLIAQTHLEGMTLITVDDQILRYSVSHL
jgi:PIN domain nuclease of toxin-antitoxin system